MYRKVNTKMEQNFSPGLALIDLSGTGPWRVEQTLRRKTKAYFFPRLERRSHPRLLLGYRVLKAIASSI